MNTKSTWLNDNIKPVLSVVVIAFVFSYFIYCTIAGAKPDQQIIIAMVASSATVLQYWFGSSSGSSKKDDTIADNIGTSVVDKANTVNVKN